MKKSKRKTVNESFTELYMNDSGINSMELDDKAHVEMSPSYAASVKLSKDIRNKMKDDFKEQDELVDKFLSEQELEERPKIKSSPELKNMKLSENLTESFPNIEDQLYDLFEREGYDTHDEEVQNYIDAAVDYIEMHPDEYSVEEWYKDTKMNYPEDLAELPRLTESAKNKKVNLNEASIFDMMDAFNDKIDELEKNESLKEEAVPRFYRDDEEFEDSVIVESLEEDLDPNNIHDFIDNWVSMDELGRMAYKWMSAGELADMLEANGYDEVEVDELEESLSLNEDYSNFIGHPLKDFLRTLDHRVKVNIDYDEPLGSGSSGISGLVHDVNWEAADRIIKDIKLGDDRYYKFKILTESKKKRIVEDSSGSLHPVPNNYVVEALSTFTKEFNKLNFTSDDYEELLQELKHRPPKASIGGSVFKFEWWPKRFNQGKKEGRVIYIEYVSSEKVYLYSIYPKNKKEDLNTSEKSIIIELSKNLRG